MIVGDAPVNGTSFVLLGGARDSSMWREGEISLHETYSISPAVSYDFSGRSVSNAGDVNGDGYDDLIIGVPYASRCYVLFGSERGFVNMTQGFTIFGAQSSDLTGWSVSGAGDVNNDTFADVIIGVPGFDSTVGAVYVLFGRSYTRQAVNVYLDTLSLEIGCVLRGISPGSYMGVSVSGAGLFISL